MPGSATQRSTTTRDRHRAVIRRGRPDCHLCHEEIDYTLRSPHPMSYEVDHVIPLDRGGTDDLDNKAAAHRDCNRRKSNHLAEELAAQAATSAGPRTFITTRTW